METKERDRLTNVIFLSEMPRQDVVPYLNISDVLLVPLRRDQLFEAFIPSKLYDYMACARPVILTVPGEAQNILEMAEAGVYVPPEDPQSLKNAILELSNKPPEVLDHYGKKGRNFVIKHFDRERQALKLAEVLQALIAPSE